MSLFSFEQIKNVYENSSSIVICCNQNGNIIYKNASANDFFGDSCSNIISLMGYKFYSLVSFVVSDNMGSCSFFSSEMKEITVTAFPFFVDGNKNFSLVLFMSKPKSATNNVTNMMFHEISTPLEIIDQASKMLLNNDSSSSPYELAQIISNSAREGLNASGTFYNITKNNIDKLVINLDIIELTEFLFDIYKQARFLTNKKGKSLVAILPEQKYYCMADENYLRHAVLNLISNAAKHGGINIELSLEVKLDYLIINVKDDGAEISHELQERIFEPYFNNDTENKGLGLYYTKYIMKNHNGKVSYKWQNNKSVFSLYLPIKIDTEKFKAFEIPYKVNENDTAQVLKAMMENTFFEEWNIF